MTYKQLLKRYGKPTAIRERFGFSKQRMNYWRATNKVPRVAMFEIAAKEQGTA